MTESLILMESSVWLMIESAFRILALALFRILKTNCADIAKSRVF